MAMLDDTLNAVEGMQISEGSVIAQLDPVPFENNLRNAEITHDEAQRAVRRFEQLSGRTISEATEEDARSAAARAEVGVDDAAYALERSALYAPFDAIVATRYVEAFSTVGAGTPVVRLLDLSELRIDIRVPEVLFQQIGENPNVRLEAKFPASEERFPLEFREINAIASDIGQTFDVTLAMTPPEVNDTTDV